MRKLALSLIVSLTLFGCTQQVVESKPISNEAQVLASQLKDYSKSELILVYKQASGLSEFIKNTNSVSNSVELGQTLKDFQSLYNQNTDIKPINDFLKSKNYSQVVNFDAAYRVKIVKDFSDIADAIQLALETKND